MNTVPEPILHTQSLVAPTLSPNAGPAPETESPDEVITLELDLPITVRTVGEPSPQPDAHGEFATPADGAKFMASFGILQIPLNGKAPFFTEWQNQGSTDPVQIDAWYAQHKCNFGSIAKAGRHCVLEVDNALVRPRFEKASGSTFTNTLTVASSRGGHRWYLHTAASTELGNVAQGNVVGGDFSFRADNEQCVSPGSIHPTTGKQYRVKVNVPPAPITQAEVDWIGSQKISKKAVAPRDSQGLIPHGYIHDQLVIQAGKLRREGYPVDAIEQALLSWTHENCAPPIDEDKVRQVARSSGNWEQGNPVERMVFHSGTVKQETEKPERDLATPDAFPGFPRWALEGTSLYEGLAKPASAASSKFPELIWMPAMMLLLNYISLKVGVGFNNIWNLYLGIVGPSGTFKSSSCELAMEYFGYANLLAQYDATLQSADGKIIVETPGSAEGFGLEMSRIKADHALMYYDELASFTDKIKGRDNSSSLTSRLLSIYESGKFANVIKRRSESFSFAPHSYCFGWLWCCTDAAFPEQWAMMRGQRSGLNTRVFFCSTPDKPKPLVLDCTDKQALRAAAGTTKERMMAAIEQGGFKYEDIEQAQHLVKELADPRAAAWLEKFSLGIAIDLGLSEIDNDCLERAAAIVRYGLEVSKLMDPGEAETMEARVQLAILKRMRFGGGEMTYRELERGCSASRFGTKLWWSAFEGLVKSEKVEADFRNKSKMVYLLKQD